MVGTALPPLSALPLASGAAGGFAFERLTHRKQGAFCHAWEGLVRQPCSDLLQALFRSLTVPGFSACSPGRHESGKGAWSWH